MPMEFSGEVGVLDARAENKSGPPDGGRRGQRGVREGGRAAE